MAQVRGRFASRLGFLMAAAGSAVGLGNVWGFPSQTANNGGGAFVVMYLVLAFLLAWPALMAELVEERIFPFFAKCRSRLQTTTSAPKTAATITTAAEYPSSWGTIGSWHSSICRRGLRRKRGILGHKDRSKILDQVRQE